MPWLRVLFIFLIKKAYGDIRIYSEKNLKFSHGESSCLQRHFNNFTITSCNTFLYDMIGSQVSIEFSSHDLRFFFMTWATDSGMICECFPITDFPLTSVTSFFFQWICFIFPMDHEHRALLVPRATNWPTDQ